MPGATFRATALLAIGAFALHQLRYLIGYGDSAGHALATQGHGYLALIQPFLGLAVAAAAGHFLAVVVRARKPAVEAAWRLSRLWFIATLALIATYTGQELLEGALTAGHPAGLAAVLAGGGWWALPLALALGLIVALALRGADAAIAAAWRRRPSRRSRRLGIQRPQPASAVLPRQPLLGMHLAGRAPPELLGVT